MLKNHVRRLKVFFAIVEYIFVSVYIEVLNGSYTALWNLNVIFQNDRHVLYLHLVILLCLFASKSLCFYNRLDIVVKNKNYLKIPNYWGTFVSLTVPGIGVLMMKVYKIPISLSCIKLPSRLPIYTGVALQGCVGGGTPPNSSANRQIIISVGKTGLAKDNHWRNQNWLPE
jgi:hypothetical protein